MRLQCYFMLCRYVINILWLTLSVANLEGMYSDHTKCDLFGENVFPIICRRLSSTINMYEHKTR